MLERLKSAPASGGTDTLPLVLLPGTLCDARLFAPVLERLPRVATLLPSLVGATTAPDMAKKLLAELPDRFVLAGFSLGGIVALEMVAQAPERIAGLALLDTTARPDPEANHRVRRSAAEAARRDGTAGYARRI